MRMSGVALRGRLRALACATVVALVPAACGTAIRQPSATTRAAARSGLSAQIPQLQPIGTNRKNGASRRLLLEVNTVCRAVRQGAPRALHTPFTTAAVERYSSSAETSARRTIVSLERLSVTGDTSTLQAVARGYRQLQAVYTSASLVARTAHGARQLGAAIQAREQFISATARAAGAPACGVVGR